MLKGMDSLNAENFTLLSAPIIGVLILLEILFSAKQKTQHYSTSETKTTILLAVIAVISNGLVKTSYIAIYAYFNSIRVFQIENVIAYWVCLLFLQDFMYWVLHYVDHHSRLFWSVHVVHHNSTDFNLTTGFRASFFQPYYRFVFMIPIALLGFRGLDIMLMYVITQVYGVLVHTQHFPKMPKLISFFLVTPSHHRVHHGSNPEYLDKNLGMLFIIWDRIFGTFQPELKTTKICYGITKNPENRGLINIILHEWVALFKDLNGIDSWGAKFKALFTSPMNFAAAHPAPTLKTSVEPPESPDNHPGPEVG